MNNDNSNKLIYIPDTNDTIILASGGDFGGTTDIVITVTDIDYNSLVFSYFYNWIFLL